LAGYIALWKNQIDDFRNDFRRQRCIHTQHDPSDSTKGVAMKAAALMPLAESHFVEGAGQFCASRKKQ
jgi:hypothetical protein